MASLLKCLYSTLVEFDEKHKDGRIENSLLLNSPLSVVLLTALYWVFVKIVGPALMRNRQPFQLKKVLLVYNLLQVLANLFIFTGVTWHIFNSSFYPDLGCMMNDRTTSEKGLSELHYTKMYFWLKVADLADTVFFVLRKSNKQITFLHVYHHIIMVIGTYLGLRYVGGGHAFMLGFVNLFVHTAMYSYYLMSALRPGMKNSLWWKKYVTQIQIVQFVLLILHFARPLLRSSCQQPTVFIVICLMQNFMMFFMFMDFYVKAYIMTPKMAKKPIE